MSSGQNKNQPAAYRIEDGVLYVRSFKTRPDYFRDNAFSGIRKIVFADDITVIPQGYASLYKDLEEITIPENVEYIDQEAFLGCSSLKRIILKTKHIPDGRFLPDDLKDRVEIVRSV